MRRFGKRLAVIGLAVLTAVLAAGCGKYKMVKQQVPTV